MTRILILTQGQLAQALLEGARTISGDSSGLSALSLGWDDGLEEAERKLGAALADLATQGDAQGQPQDQDTPVLILTDVPGGTPFNVASRFAEPGRVAVLSGVNLAMAVRVCCPGCTEFSLEELATWLEEKGRESIRRGHKTVSSDSEAQLAAPGGGEGRP